LGFIVFIGETRPLPTGVFELDYYDFFAMVMGFGLLFKVDGLNIDVWGETLTDLSILG